MEKSQKRADSFISPSEKKSRNSFPFFFRTQTEQVRPKHWVLSNASAGFTFVELLVVVAIISILSTIIIASVSDSRARARDGQRVAELAQIELALEQYRQFNDTFPDSATFDAGVTIGEGGALDSLIAPFLSSVPDDPLSGTSGYEYYYDSDYRCDGEDGHIALFAIKVERSSTANLVEECGSGSASGDIGADEAEVYVVVLQ